MYKVITILVVLALTFQVGASLGIVALYKANKDYIAKALCENRTKPELQCKGKCYLKKQLEKTEDGENDKQSSQSETIQFVSYALPVPGWDEITYHPEISDVLHFPNFISFIGVNTCEDIFRPPQHSC